MQLGMQLPSLVSLHRWLRPLDLLPGLNQPLLNCIKSFAENFNSYERDCILMWDEMRIKTYIEYDRRHDTIVGVVDHGGMEKELIPAKEALVFLVRGISGNWSFPVSFYFSSEATQTSTISRLLPETIDALEKIGLNVRACMSEMVFTNQGVFRKLKISESSPFIWRNRKKIYCLYDSCHLIKLVRNNLKSKGGFVFNSGTAKWEHIERAYAYDTGTTNRLMPKLTED